MMVSLVLHAAIVSLVVFVPFLLFEPLPEPSRSVAVFFYDPPPPPPPPPPFGSGLAPTTALKRAAREPEPREEAALVATVTAPVAPVPDADSGFDGAGGDPEGSPLGVPEGMEGGVEGGVVGGIPGGVVGGVIGGTGTGPVPVMRPDRPPRPIRLTRPEYPQEAFVKKVEGVVVLEILIDAGGRVARARVLQSVPLLDEAALRAVRSWTFVPAQHQGRPVASLARAPITFRIY